MKNKNAFKDFMTDEVNLNQSRIDKLEEKIGTIKTFLTESFDCFRKTEKQGSYASHTIIKPVKDNDEFDADLLIYCKINENWEPKDYIQEIYNLFHGNGNYKKIVRKKTRCVTIDYSGDFHLDLVPCIEKDGKVYICNFDDNEFEESDGTGYRQWLAEKTAHTNGELKRVIRLMKYMRDHKDNFSAKSILLTTLLGNHVDNISSSDFTDTATALYKILESLNTYLQDHPTMPTIENPVLPGDNFNRHWDQKKYENFRSKIEIYFNKIKDAYNDENHNSSIKKWRMIFGDCFGTLIENNSSSGTQVTPQKPHSTGWK